MRQRFSFAPLVYVILLMTPVYWLVIMSFKTNGEIAGALTFFPHEPTFANYAMIFGDPDWYLGYVNALIYVLLNVLISVSVALPAAYAFSRYDFFGRRGLFFGLLHFSTGWSAVPVLIFLGTLFAILYEKTGSLWPPIILHAINNGFAMVVLSAS